MHWVGFVGILTLLVVIAGAIGSLVLWYFVLRRPPMAHPTCGHCGYIVEGLEKMYCPECGSDFRRVGIVAPRQRTSVHPVLFVICWTLFLPPTLLVISMVPVIFGFDLPVWMHLGLLAWVAAYVSGLAIYFRIRAHRRQAWARSPGLPTGDGDSAG